MEGWLRPRKEAAERRDSKVSGLEVLPELKYVDVHEMIHICHHFCGLFIHSFRRSFIYSVIPSFIIIHSYISIFIHSSLMLMAQMIHMMVMMKKSQGFSLIPNNFSSCQRHPHFQKLYHHFPRSLRRFIREFEQINGYSRCVGVLLNRH